MSRHGLGIWRFDGDPTPLACSNIFFILRGFMLSLHILFLFKNGKPVAESSEWNFYFQMWYPFLECKFLNVGSGHSKKILKNRGQGLRHRPEGILKKKIKLVILKGLGECTNGLIAWYLWSVHILFHDSSALLGETSILCAWKPSMGCIKRKGP